jgi:hypothetical protein
MANIIPLQERAVDPFSSFYSNTVNRLTELVTHDEEGLLTVPSLNVISDTTSPTTTVIVKPGYIVKDDVLIKIKADHSVDFLDDDNWVSPPDITFPGGNCYVVLHYVYQKQRPAPVATIKILQPSQRNIINLPGSPYFLLKVVELDTVNPHPIIGLYDYDTESGYEDNKRKYLKYYAGGEVNLPTHNRVTDQGRIAYESERNKFFFGYESEWKELTVGGVEVNINTDSTGIIIGQICYVNSSGNATPSISTSIETGADIVVTAIGTAIDATGRGIITGFATGVPVETGILIGVGDLLYLSAVEAGTVTNVRPNQLFQMVGRALTSASSTTPVDMIFAPKAMLAPSVSGQITTWSGPDASGYYKDIDVSLLDGTDVFDCHWFDDDTKKEVTPSDVEIRNGGDIIRVYFSVNTLTINYMIQSPESYGGGSGGGGGGGGGTSDHSLLLSLDYAGSGHTGFAPSPHNNTHHSQTYITSSSVNFTTLNGNGSVGALSNQVAIGNHLHPQYIDVPSGLCILFNSNTAVSGYSLVTTIDDALVYITKGSAAGGENGAQWKSGGSWTQPSHNHGIVSAPNHTHTFTSSSHTHSVSGTTGVNSGSGEDQGDGTNVCAPINHTHAFSVTSGGSTVSGTTNNAGSHDHTGATTMNATANTWRPRGWNMTLQCRS